MYENKIIVRGEAALILAIIVNSMGGDCWCSSQDREYRQYPVCLTLLVKYFPNYRWEHGHIFFRDFWWSHWWFWKRDLSEIIGKPYSKVKITFDVTCLVVTACLTYFALGKILGLGIGTVVAAFTMGKGVSIAGSLIDKKMVFVSVLHKELEEAV